MMSASYPPTKMMDLRDARDLVELGVFSVF